MLAAAWLCGCERVAQSLDELRPAAPAPSVRVQPSAPDATTYGEPGAAPIPPWELHPESEILFSLEAWDTAPSAVRAEAAEALIERLPLFNYVGLQTFAGGGQTHELAVFEHIRTGLVFVLLPASSFRMGSPTTEDGRKFDETRHTVDLTRPFLICRTEVTQSAWTAVRSKNPAANEGSLNPVEMVTIIDIGRFLMRTKLDLPTEAQWEYACRAGTTTAYSFGDDASHLGEHAWYAANSGGKTHPVGEKTPNAFGLHDMHGNVLEWCRDRYGPLTESSVTDPEGLPTAADQVVRGGSWQNPADVQRSAFRLRTNPADKQPGIGFRPVMLIPAPR